MNCLYLGLGVSLLVCTERGGQPDAAIETTATLESRDPWLAIVEADGNPAASMAYATYILGRADVSRRELIPVFRRIARQRGPSQVVKAAQRMADMLTAMALEDEKHQSVSANSGASRAQIMADLVFQLRDQRGGQHWEFGRCDIFLDPRKGLSPAGRLTHMGDDAVPQLIDALDDFRPTRCVECRKDGICYALTVGDCAVEILERIAMQKFWDASPSAGHMAEKGKISVTRTAIKAWWAERLRTKSSSTP